MSGEKVLIVEDESIVATHVKTILQSKGFDVMGPISTGEDAIKKIDESIPDLVIIDSDYSVWATIIEGSVVFQK